MLLLIKKAKNKIRFILKVGKYDLIKIFKSISIIIFFISKKNSKEMISPEKTLRMKGVARVKGSEGFKHHLEQFISRYSINDLEIIPGNKNISFPICDELTMLKIYREFRDHIFKYYLSSWGVIPILQDCPRLVISYPHSLYDLSGGFPEKFHKDYLTELTVHIPLIEINDSMPHTEYIEYSHFKPRIIDEFFNNHIDQGQKFPKKLFCKKGDYIILDVSGLHRGSMMSKSNPRIMLQYKFIGKAFDKECDLLNVFEGEGGKNKILGNQTYSENHIIQSENILSKSKLYNLKEKEFEYETKKAYKIFNLIQSYVNQ